MQHSLEHLKKQAKALRRDFAGGDGQARARVRAFGALPEGALPHATALFVVAREQGFDSWPKLKFAIESRGFEREQAQDSLGSALYHGQAWVVAQLLSDTPDLAKDHLGLQVALYDLPAVQAALAADPTRATASINQRSPILHLAFSKWVQARPERQADMLAIAQLLLEHGADVNDGFASEPGSDHRLSALYGAIGHVQNMPLAELLLQNGADPNDNESLYHATELGHTRGLKLLLDHGAQESGTNTLLHALDFNDLEMVRLLLDHGASPNQPVAPHPSGEPSLVISALHQAARRHCDAAIVELLLERGAERDHRWQGITPYAFARIFGNGPVAGALARAGADVTLTPTQAILARAADDAILPGDRIDPSELSGELRYLPTAVMELPNRLDHVKRLISLGFDPDAQNAMGLPALHVAGWSGQADAFAWLMTLSPDLDHVNGYGGTVLGTILHGSENSAKAPNRDHIACLKVLLNTGFKLPKRTIRMAGSAAVREFLEGWAEDHPDQLSTP